jgi:hypothetical protein
MADNRLPESPSQRRLAAIFRDHGVVRGVSFVQPVAEDEAVFVVPPSDAAKMRERSLTLALSEALERKVWVTTDEDVRRDRLAPLAAWDR